ncbi:hypothetical protein BU14_2086s0001 [Porphyra umbilicalis]|uniref:Uncharacterized protein n=1 Tax=Porphyra umbilicalis TaxID=2786 RepID=A0A1X6NJY9_PORUM|nr:hypothetical protein BU14_2086s0001 [Porphyra umbilicalis]|eukprot:OSX68924.1 hypothetical protein BU14_2086s0001 [Porphyra umbilicalis]
MIEQGWSGRVDGTDPPPLRCFFERCHRGLMSSPRKTRSSSKGPSAAASSDGGRSDEAAGVRPVVPLVRLIATATGPTQEALSSAVVKSKGRRLVLESVSVMLLSGKGVPEQPVSGGSAHERIVSSEMAKLNNAYKSKSVTAKARKTLRYLHLPVVFCSDGCEVDMAYYIEVEGVRRVLAVHELKTPRFAPALALQQVAKYACAAAAGLCQGGVPSEQIVVPMMVSTGLLELHGAAYMATPSLPVAITTSSTLDVNTKQGAAAAHLYRRKAKEQMDRLEVAVRDAAKSPRFTVIKNALFPANGEAGAVPSFQPSFNSTAVWPKWSAVSDVAPGGVDAQVFHMHRAFQALYASTAARFVCFPFCYAAGIKCAPTGSDAGRSALLFPNLLSSGYQSALPKEIAVACMYVKAVKRRSLRFVRQGSSMATSTSATLCGGLQPVRMPSR